MVILFATWTLFAADTLHVFGYQRTVPHASDSMVDQKGPTASDSVAARGRSQFARSCAFCHGADASGSSEGPDLIRSSVVRHDSNGDRIGPVIREGQPAKGMPPVALSESQIADVVAFLHARVTESDRRSAGHPSALYSLDRLLTGSAGAGKQFFGGRGGCAQCHSITADLAGIARKYPPVELQARFLYPSGVKETATVVTRSGAQRSGELIYVDAFNVAIQGADGWYHSWPRDEVKLEIHDPLAAHRDLLKKYTEADMHNVFAYLETLK